MAQKFPLTNTMAAPVAEIRFEGNEDVGEDVLCNELTFGEGNLLKDKHLRKATESLLELGKFDSADVVVSEGDQGLIITFQLVEKWHVMSAWGLGVGFQEPLRLQGPPRRHQAGGTGGHDHRADTLRGQQNHP